MHLLKVSIAAKKCDNCPADCNDCCCIVGRTNSITKLPRREFDGVYHPVYFAGAARDGRVPLFNISSPPFYSIFHPSIYNNEGLEFRAFLDS